MKTIGLLGGMSWESSIVYDRSSTRRCAGFPTTRLHALAAVDRALSDS